jgi:hypothetical protein
MSSKQQRQINSSASMPEDYARLVGRCKREYPAGFGRADAVKMTGHCFLRARLYSALRG